jgi:hypothetical protein
LDLQFVRELADMPDFDPLPVNGFNVAFQCSLESPSVQDVERVLLRFVPLRWNNDASWWV